jgi:hypothetical protein
MAKAKDSAAFPPVRNRPANTSDPGRVRFGNTSPPFQMMPPLVRGRPVTISNTGEVRIGEFRPADSPAAELNIRIAASPTLIGSE